MTEAKPISTARARFIFNGLDRVDGIAINSAGRDAYGVAVLSGVELAASVISPRVTFGTNPTIPVLTVTGRVAATAATARIPLGYRRRGGAVPDGTSVVYPTLISHGVLTVADVLSISDVRPGAATAAGSIVSITGRGLSSETRVR